MLGYSKDDIEKIKHLISEGANQEAINALRPIVEGNNELEDTVLMLKTRLSTLQKSVREGTIDSDDANVERNKINRALLDVLNILEDLDKHQKNTLTEVQSKKDEIPVETSTHPVSEKQGRTKKLVIPTQWLTRGALALVTILITVLIERTLNSWLEADKSAAPANLAVRLVFQPEFPGIEHSGTAKLTVGKFVSELKPVPPDGKLFFTGIPAENADDSVKVILQDTRYPCKVASQSNYNLQKTGDITAFVELATTTYSGKVLYPNSKPAAGVEIEFENGMARDLTDAEGNYTVALPDLKKRLIQVVIRQNGKVILSREIGLHPAPLREIKILPD
jgi:hypothetical protein